jgi:hypothetical protein
MTRQGWILAVGAGLCCGLLPACSHTAAESLADHAPVAVAPPAEAPPEPAPSPYHPTTSQPRAETPPGDVQVKQATYPPPVPPARPVLSVAELHRVEDPSAEKKEPPAPAATDPVARRAEDPPLVAALRCFLDKRPAEAVQLLEPYDKANQDLLLCLLPLAARLTEGGLGDASPQELTNLVCHLEGVLPPLRARAELLLERMCFCSWIGGYGRYEPLPEGHAFHIGEPVQVYVELQNVSSPLRGETYVTQLASSVVIYDGARRERWRHDFGDRQYCDVSQTLRHDYFNNCRFCVPDMPPGQYTLCIQVEDVPTGRVARRSLDFRVTTIAARDS